MKINRFYVFLSIIASIITFFVVLYFVKNGYYLAFLSAIVAFFLLINFKRYKKNKNYSYMMEKDSIYFFETFMMFLDCNYSIEDALIMASKKNNCDISKKFKICYRKNKTKSFEKLLIDFKNSLGSLQIKNIITEIINSYRLDGSSRQDVRNQVNFLYDTKIGHIKTEISNIPILIAFVTLFILIPLLLGIMFYEEAINILFR